MTTWLWPLFLQGALIAVDELHFHRRRDLPRWERLGHPVDTLFFFLCALMAWRLNGPQGGGLYLGAAVLSSILITKDEFVHRRVCTASECWIHSLLFVLHPVALWSLWQLHRENQQDALKIVNVLIGLLLLYQIFYWNLPWHRNPPK